MGSKTRIKDKKTQLVFRDNKQDMTLKEQTKIHSSTDIELEDLDRKIDSITKLLSRPYFNKDIKVIIQKKYQIMLEAQNKWHTKVK
ncbi:MAG TPA: hypothetical protein VJ767_05545 [Nitrososphaeraceae archaeon]|nr:hypothetical protein [Nitrososphaeraceae archaeon]